MEKTMQEEFDKCIKSPYYYATKYLIVNGKPFTTKLSEQDFNKMFGITVKDKWKEAREALNMLAESSDEQRYFNKAILMLSKVFVHPPERV